MYVISLSQQLNLSHIRWIWVASNQHVPVKVKYCGTSYFQRSIKKIHYRQHKIFTFLPPNISFRNRFRKCWCYDCLDFFIWKQQRICIKECLSKHAYYIHSDVTQISECSEVPKIKCTVCKPGWEQSDQKHVPVCCFKTTQRQQMHKLSIWC